MLQTRRAIAARPSERALPGDAGVAGIGDGDSSASASNTAFDDALSNLDTALARTERILSGGDTPAKAQAAITAFMPVAGDEFAGFESHTGGGEVENPARVSKAYAGDAWQFLEHRPRNLSRGSGPV